MKLFIKTFLLSILTFSIILYFTSIKEGMEVLKIQGSYLENIGESFGYFLNWCLPYWWSYLIPASLTISFITVIFRRKNVN